MKRGLAAQFQRDQLHRAAANGDLSRVQELLAAKYPVNRFDQRSRTPLHYAVAGEHLAVVDLLLRSGANVNAREEKKIGETPLGECVANCSFEMAKRLIDAGADPTLLGWMMRTALDRAKDRKRDEGRHLNRLMLDAARRQSSSKS